MKGNTMKNVKAMSMLEELVLKDIMREENSIIVTKEMVDRYWAKRLD